MINSTFNTYHCPLCSGKDCKLFLKDTQREYLRCLCCELVFVPKSYWLNPKDEKVIYDLHQNSPNDEGYRKFLSRLTTPLLQELSPDQKGLDFGCGPGPTLSHILEEHGHRVELYDPYYYDNPSIFSNSYDFICATEVVEHLKNPQETFSTLFQMLNGHGWLGVMTKMVTTKESFKNWHYIRDLTHICFYNTSSFEYIAKRFKSTVTFRGNDVILFQKM